MPKYTHLICAITFFLMIAQDVRAQGFEPMAPALQLLEVPDMVLQPVSMGASFDGSKAPYLEFEERKDVLATGQRRGRRSSGRRRSGRRRSTMPPRRGGKAYRSQSITVPVQVGLGPTANFVTGVIQSDQLVHTGLRLNLQAVITKQLIRQQAHRIPRQYKAMAANITEVRMRPNPTNWIPTELVISPKLERTGVYGATIKPIALGLGLTPSPVRFGVDAGLIVKYLYIDSDVLGTTHFLRPGLELKAELEFSFGDIVWLSMGWASQVFIPQKVGGLPWEALSLDDSIWHIGQAFALLHVRIPYTTTL